MPDTTSPAGTTPTDHPKRLQVFEHNEEALFADGHDDALIGVATRYGMPPVAAYDYEKVIEELMKDGMDRDAAEEFFDFNIIGAWVGENTPVFVRLL